jgi:hypothetical protein
MEQAVFERNVNDLKRFFLIYCSDKHPEVPKTDHDGLLLCDRCSTLYMYALARLQQCPLDPKPKCRTCSVRCYEKMQWKSMAAVMRYAGLRLGILRIRKKLGLAPETP